MGRKIYNTEIILEKFKLIHGEKYQYPNFSYDRINNRMIDKINIICPLHGLFNQRIDDHKNGHGCSGCMADKLKRIKTKYTTEDIINEFRQVHGDLYNYDDLQYKSIKEKCQIFCKIHGPFYQCAYDHKKGHGCMRCTNKGVITSNWFSWNKKRANEKSSLYLMEFKNQNEIFYKIGLSKNPRNRKQKYGTCYDRKLIHTINGRLQDIYNLEQELLNYFLINNSYRPLNDINGGNTECFIANEKLLLNIINIMKFKEIQWNSYNEIKPSD